MRWFHLIRWFGWLGVAFSNSHVSITRTSLPHANIISLQPQGWLSRAVKPSYVQSSSSPGQSGSRIREVVYVASHLTLHPEELDDDDCLSDHHFCSLLCDRGLTVHIVRPRVRAFMNVHETEAGSVAAVSLEYMEAISHLVKSRINEHRVPATAISLIANELSAPRLLTYLAETALPMTPQRANIGCVVLIDPPPLLTLLSPEGSSRVLQRYIAPLRSATAYRQLVCPRLPLKSATRLWKRLYRHYWGGNSSVGRSLLAAVKTADLQQQQNDQRDIMQYPEGRHSPPSIREKDTGSTSDQIDDDSLNPSNQQGLSLPDPAHTLLQQYILDQELRLLARDAADDEDDPWARRLRSVRSRRLQGRRSAALSGGTDTNGFGASGDSGSGSSGGSRGVNGDSVGSADVDSSLLRCLSPAALVGVFPPKASLVASALLNRILVISTAAATDTPLQSLTQPLSPSPSPSPYDALVGSFAQQRDSDGVDGGEDSARDGGNDWGLQMTVDTTSDVKDEWGLEATLEVAHLYQAGPVIELSSDDDDDEDDSDYDDWSEGGDVAGGTIPRNGMADAGGAVGTLAGEDEDVCSDDDEANGLTWRELEEQLRDAPPPPQKPSPTVPVGGTGGRVLSRKQRQKMQSPCYRQLLVSRGWSYERAGSGVGGGGVGGGRTRSDYRSKDVGESGTGAVCSVTDRGEEAGDDDEMDHLVWSPSAIRRHRQLARVVMDWWDMLPVFGYL